MRQGAKIIVTGASGYIGQHALGPLLDHGCEVFALARRPRKSWPAGVRSLALDLFDDAARRAAFETIKPDGLLHLAWYTEHGKFWEARENIVWLALSIRMVEELASIGTQRVVVAGTCAEYIWDGSICEEATTPLKPKSLYGICKATLFRFLTEAAPKLNLDFAWGRIFLLYGDDETSSRLIPATAISLLRGEPAPCTHGRQIRDFLHVKDVARAFAELMVSPVSGAVNIGSGKPVSIASVVTEMAKRAGRPDLLKLGAVPARDNDVPALFPDVRRLFDKVGFTPAIRLGEGLDQTLDWWRAHSARSAG